MATVRNNFHRVFSPLSSLVPAQAPGCDFPPMHMDETDLWYGLSFIDNEMRSTCGLDDRLLIGSDRHVFLNRQGITISKEKVNLK